MYNNAPVAMGRQYHGSGSVRSVIQKKFDSTSFCARDGSDPSIILRRSIAK